MKEDMQLRKLLFLMIACCTSSGLFAGQIEERAKAECKGAIEARIPKTRDLGAIGITRVKLESVQYVGQIFAVSGPNSSNPYKPEYGNNNFVPATAFTKNISNDPRMGSYTGLSYQFDCVFSTDGKRVSIKNISAG
jgi:hypothetical protein